MEKSCNIVRDLLALYAENMVHADTRSFVEEHLSHCAECSAKLRELQSPPAEIPVDAIPLKALQTRLRRRQENIILCTAAWVAAVLVCIFALLTAPQFFPYSEDLLTISETGSGALAITFDEKVSGCSWRQSQDPDTGETLYCIDAWRTTLDAFFSRRKAQSMMITPASPDSTLIYYAQNNGSDDILIHGLPIRPDERGKTLPRLVLGYYILLALSAFFALLILRGLSRRQEDIKRCLDRVLPFPVSYLAAHILIKGFSVVSYSLQRDFFLILLTAILIFSAVLFYQNLRRARQENPAA